MGNIIETSDAAGSDIKADQATGSIATTSPSDATDPSTGEVLTLSTPLPIEDLNMNNAEYHETNDSIAQDVENNTISTTPNGNDTFDPCSLMSSTERLHRGVEDRAVRRSRCSETLTDTDSFMTADDEDQVSSSSDIDDIDTLSETLRAGELTLPTTAGSVFGGNDEQFVPANVSCLMVKSASSDDVDDGSAPKQVVEKDQRRNSYHVAISEPVGFSDNDDENDLDNAEADDSAGIEVHDLDPVEFTRRKLSTDSPPFIGAKVDGCVHYPEDETSSLSEGIPCDLDPAEFNHSAIKSADDICQLSPAMAGHNGEQSDDDDDDDDDNVLMDPLPADDPSLPAATEPSENRQRHLTERSESTVESSPPPTLVIRPQFKSTTSPISLTDRTEQIIRQPARRTVISLMSQLSQLDDGLSESDTELSKHDLHRNNSVFENGYGVMSGAGAKKFSKALPIVEATVCETTELIRATVIRTHTYSWEKFIYEQPREPLKPLDIRVEELLTDVGESPIPSPDYLSSSSEEEQSETSAVIHSRATEAIADIVRSSCDDEIFTDRSEAEPEPDYDMSLSPLSPTADDLTAPISPVAEELFVEMDAKESFVEMPSEEPFVEMPAEEEIVKRAEAASAPVLSVLKVLPGKEQSKDHDDDDDDVAGDHDEDEHEDHGHDVDADDIDEMESSTEVPTTPFARAGSRRFQAARASSAKVAAPRLEKFVEEESTSEEKNDAQPSSSTFLVASESLTSLAKLAEETEIAADGAKIPARYDTSAAGVPVVMDRRERRMYTRDISLPVEDRNSPITVSSDSERKQHTTTAALVTPGETLSRPARRTARRGKTHKTQKPVSTASVEKPQQFSVVLRRNEQGFGMTMTGAQPAFIYKLQENGVAMREGVKVGDKILKINGTLVTNCSHEEIVKHIKAAGAHLCLHLMRGDTERQPSPPPPLLTTQPPIPSMMRRYDTMPTNRRQTPPLYDEKLVNRSLSPSSTYLYPTPMPTESITNTAAMEIMGMDDDDDDDEMEFSRTLETQDQIAFGSSAQLKQKPAHLAVLIKYVLNSNNDPAPLLFSIIADGYNRGGANGKELQRWAHEIYATFIAESAPLKLSVDATVAASIHRVVASKTELEPELKNLLQSAVRFTDNAITAIVQNFLTQRAMGLSGMFGDQDLKANMDRQEELRVVQSALWKLFEQYSRESSDRSQAIAASLAAFFKHVGYVDATGVLTSCPSFNYKDKDKKPAWLKNAKQTHLGHQFMPISSIAVCQCAHCGVAIWCAFSNGLSCTVCQINIHKYCLTKLNANCKGPLRRGRPADRSSSTRVVSSIMDTIRRPAGSPENRPHISLFEPAKLMLERNIVTVSNQFMTLPASPTKFLIHDPDLDVEWERPPLEASIPKEELKKLKKDEKKRQEVINELFYTERAYMRTLKVIYLMFYQPMLAENWIPRDLTMTLFPGIDKVIQAHTALNNEFKERKLRGAVVQNVGDILLKNFSGANGDQFIAACSVFCRDQAHVLNLLRARVRKEPKLGLFLQDAASDPRCRRQELKDLLPQVMSRLAKYPLLIDSLLKHTPKDTEEYVQLTEAGKCVRGILHKVNEAVRERENLRKVNEIRKHFEIRLMDASTDPVLAEFKDLQNKVFPEKLLYDGKLAWRLGGGKQIDVRVALFSNVVLLLQPQDDKLVLRCHNVTLVGRDKIPHGPIIKLQNLMVRPHAADKRAFFLIVTMKMMPRRYELVTSSSDENSKWCKFVNEAIEAVKSQPVLPITATSVASQMSSMLPTEDHAADDTSVLYALDSTDAIDRLDHVDSDGGNIIEPAEPSNVDVLEILNNSTAVDNSIVNDAVDGSVIQHNDSVHNETPLVSSRLHTNDLLQTIYTIHRLLNEKQQIAANFASQHGNGPTEVADSTSITTEDENFDIGAALVQMCSVLETLTAHLETSVSPGVDNVVNTMPSDADSRDIDVTFSAAQLTDLSLHLHRLLAAALDVTKDMDQQHVQLQSELREAWNQLSVLTGFPDGANSGPSSYATASAAVPTSPVNCPASPPTQSLDYSSD